MDILLFIITIFPSLFRQPIFQLGGVPALAELIQIESDIHKELSFEAGTIGSVIGNGSSVQASMNRKSPCLEVRRNAVIALTNLTFGNAPIKSFLCSLINFCSSSSN